MTRTTLRSWGSWLAAVTLLVGSALPFHSLAATGANAPENPAEVSALLSIPLGNGLPVVVRTGLYFHHIEAFEDNKGSFEATTDLRLSWHDPRLRYPASEGLRGYKEYRVSAAEAQLAKLWTPPVRYANRIGEPSFSERRLRIYPDGRVETIARTTAVYKTPVDVSRFPFDHQALQIELVVREDTVESVDLDYSSEDVEFSKAGKRVELGGWTPGLVHLERELVAGWNGDRYAKVRVALDVRRDAAGTVATIFIPLFASLLIPFLATWMNRAEGAGFAIEGFELANVIVGGVFAVIALGFTINSAFPLLAQSDNTVSRLLGLNYTALAVGLVITVAFYRYNLPARWFGAHVQEQMFRFLAWAFPVAFIATGLCFVAMAAA